MPAQTVSATSVRGRPRAWSGSIGASPSGPPAFDRLPEVLTSCPGPGRGAADEATVGAHEGQQGRGEVVRALGGGAGEDVASAGRARRRPSCAPVAAPRRASVRSTRVSRSASHRPGSWPSGGSVPFRFSWLMRRRRRVAAMSVLTAAWTVGMSSRAKTNRVRRIAIHRTRLRRSYIAAATSARVLALLRASTEI